MKLQDILVVAVDLLAGRIHEGIAVRVPSGRRHESFAVAIVVDHRESGAGRTVSGSRLPRHEPAVEFELRVAFSKKWILNVYVKRNLDAEFLFDAGDKSPRLCGSRTWSSIWTAGSQGMQMVGLVVGLDVRCVSTSALIRAAVT
jgi:hypothetical protein